MQNKDICDQCRQQPITKITRLECCGYRLCSACLKENYNSSAKIRFNHKCKNLLQPPHNNKAFCGNQNKNSTRQGEKSSITKENSKYCEKHKKGMELICLEDKQLVCTHCAIFGEHQGHKMLTIDEFEEELTQKMGALNGIRELKKEMDLKLKGKEFQVGITEQLNKRKDRLILEIRTTYKQVHEQLKEAQEKTYNELIKAFRAINTQIVHLNREKQEIQKQYREWEKDCQKFMNNYLGASSVLQKAKIYYERFIDHISEGKQWVRNFQQKNSQMKEKIITLINGININSSTSALESQIYNFIQIKSTLCVRGSLSQPPVVKSMNASKVSDFEMSQTSFTKERMNYSGLNVQLSPKAKSVLSAKTTFPRKKFGEVRMIKKEEGDMYRHLDNLAFAERMLTDFKKSKDTLDMTGCSLNDQEIYQVILAANEHKSIQNLKLSKNKLTNEGLSQILPYLDYTTSLNVSYNQLTEDVFDELLKCKEGLPYLRIVNLTHNRIINEKRAKAKTEDLKKMGVIVTL